MLVLLFVLSLLLPPSGVTLTTTLTDELTITIQTDAPRGFYVEIDTTRGVTADAVFFQFELAAGEQFGKNITVTILPVLHLSPESVRVRVWTSDGGEAPLIEQRIPIPTASPLRLYLPHI
jgi:hypothetical protein